MKLLTGILGGIIASAIVALVNNFMATDLIASSIIEELIKMTAIVLIVLLLFKSSKAVKVGFGVGIGFVLAETAIYMLKKMAGDYGSIPMQDFLSIRLLYPGIMHMFTGVIASIGLEYDKNRMMMVVFTLIIAIVIHLIFNIIMNEFGVSFFQTGI